MVDFYGKRDLTPKVNPKAEVGNRQSTILTGITFNTNECNRCSKHGKQPALNVDAFPGQTTASGPNGNLGTENAVPNDTWINGGINLTNCKNIVY